MIHLVLYAALWSHGAPPTVVDERVTRTVTQVIDDAEAAFQDQDYERALVLIEAALARGAEMTVEDRKRTYRLEGMALAIARGPESAEPPFRLWLRLDPEASLDPSTPPKILLPFKKVAAEERLLREQERAVRRQRLADLIRIDVSAPDAVRGGQAVHVYAVVDAGEATLTEVTLQFRRRGKPEVSRFAFVPEGARWRAEIPAGLTATSEGFVLEHWVTVGDAEGVLKSAGSPAQPFVTYVAQGEVEDQTMLVGIGIGAGVMAGLAALGIGAFIGAQLLMGPPASELGVVRVP